MSTTIDPIAFGQAAARSTLAQERPRLRGLPGGRRPDAVVPGRSHVTNLRSSTPATPTVLLAVTVLEASLIRSVLRASGALSCMELAAQIEQQCHPSCVVEVDPANPHGMVRPS